MTEKTLHKMQGDDVELERQVPIGKAEVVSRHHRVSKQELERVKGGKGLGNQSDLHHLALATDHVEVRKAVTYGKDSFVHRFAFYLATLEADENQEPNTLSKAQRRWISHDAFLVRYSLPLLDQLNRAQQIQWIDFETELYHDLERLRRLADVTLQLNPAVQLARDMAHRIRALELNARWGAYATGHPLAYPFPHLMLALHLRQICEDLNVEPLPDEIWDLVDRLVCTTAFAS